MTIYYDPTEGRAGTRLPKSLVTSGVSLPGLERATSADMLISPMSNPVLTEVTDSRASQIKLQHHTRSGLLVQRKTGGDLVNSIPKLGHIIERMLDFTEAFPPWLLIVGEYKADRKGYIIVDGTTSGWKYNAVQGALENWQLRGGGLSIIQRDGLVPAWASRWHRKLAEISDHGLDDDELRVPRSASKDSMPWRITLTTFPEIGIEKATAIAKYCGTLANALTFLSDPRHQGMKIKDDLFPKGLGPTTFARARDWLGLETGPETLETMCTTVDTDLEGIKKWLPKPRK